MPLPLALLRCCARPRFVAGPPSSWPAINWPVSTQLAIAMVLAIPLVLALATTTPPLLAQPGPGIAVASDSGESDAVAGVATDYADANSAGADQFIDAEWIWSPAYQKDNIPPGPCYFRKTFRVGQVTKAEIHICADNQYELFVNGKQVGTGNDWRAMEVVDLTEHLAPGQNTIAVAATNADAGAAGLVARVIVAEAEAGTREFSTDITWKASLRPDEGWQQPSFDDRDWVPAASFGPLGLTLPWGNEVVIAGIGARFRFGSGGFAVDQVATEDATGSVIAMAFDHQGSLLVSRERGPLIKLKDTNNDGTFDASETFCDAINSAQGILPLAKEVLAVGIGPQGPGLYAIGDQTPSGNRAVRQILAFTGTPGEHGPHAVRLGRDGMIYVMLGNMTGYENPAATSPLSHWYEGDLLTPRHEDPKGHAVGVRAPGGVLLRTTLDGKRVEFVAGGLRNAYDFASTETGEWLTYDADMEWDLGAPWYRPTRIVHATAGAEFGWRSGWAKWPAYYHDSLPAVLDLGPGSPTGMTYFDHFAYPRRYQGGFFACDWAEGAIDHIRITRQGASYTATAMRFLEGTPLNVTDCAVGPGGQLYFCTGGRGTAGGVYRVRYLGEVPADAKDLGTGVLAALNQPQLDEPWAQARIASIRRQLGDQWSPLLLRYAQSETAKSKLRVRALWLMHLFGPRWDDAQLLALATTNNDEVRAAILRQLAMRIRAQQAPAPELRNAILAGLRDASPLVRRVACESLRRAGLASASADIMPLLGDSDRHVRFAARRALESQPVDSWQEEVLTTAQTRTFIEGSTSLLTVQPQLDSATRILNRIAGMLRGEVNDPQYPQGFIPDDAFLDLLRLSQLAMQRERLKGEEELIAAWQQAATQLGRELLLEYPTTNPAMNRELTRLLVFSQAEGAAPLFAQQVTDATVAFGDKLHVAACASRLKVGWDRESKLAMIRFYDAARHEDGGYSLGDYTERFAREFFQLLTDEEKQQVLRAGVDWPSSALSVLAGLPKELSPAMVDAVQELDRKISQLPGDPIARLRVGTTVTLARSTFPAQHAYLRETYTSTPPRRTVIAMALTQQPSAENRAVFLDALATAEGSVAQELFAALLRCEPIPLAEQDTAAETSRRIILAALKGDLPTAERASRLLASWTGVTTSGIGSTSEELMQPWQSWYANQFPDAPPAELPHEAAATKWSFAELSNYLTSPAAKQASPHRGREVFTRATCIKCHRMAGEGESLGPDLTTIARRFQTKEILEAVLYPSHVISDQYQSQNVETNGLTLSGIVAPDGEDAIIVLQSDGRKRRVLREDIDDISPSRLSAMPAGLLDELTLEQVADLFAYLKQPPGKTSPGAERAAQRSSSPASK